MPAETPDQVAQRFLDASQELRTELGIPANAKLAATPLAQGEHNANFTFMHPATGKKLVLRVNYESQLGLENQIGYEIQALRALEPSGRTAKVLFADESKQLIDHGVLVMEFFEGAWLNFHNSAEVEEAARILADVHSVVPAADCPLITPADPLRAQFEACVAFFDRYSHSSFAEPMASRYVEGFIKEAEAALATSINAADVSHIQNTEAVPSHFLIPKEGPGHMVDWEKPVIGEVAQDLAYFMSPTTTIWDTDYLFDPPARAAFLQAYWRAVDERFEKGNFEVRYEAYVMMNALLGVTWSCNALVDYAGEDKVLKNEKTANLLATYVSEDFLRRVQHDCFQRKGH